MSAVDRHLAACARFGEAVRAAGGRWDRPSPCREWDARGVLEHVIGFHDVLLLRPLEAKPQRPRDDPERRWAVTEDALGDVLRRRADELDLKLVAALTQDVVIHAWDLARAVGADDRLDPELCDHLLARVPDDLRALAGPGMFAPPVDVPDAADPQARLLARLGRDPAWRPHPAV